MSEKIEDSGPPCIGCEEAKREFTRAFKKWVAQQQDQTPDDMRYCEVCAVHYDGDGPCPFH